jgi:epoxyqueuosine reductase
MEAWKAPIRNRARELGFAQCGFTTVGPPLQFKLYTGWIAAGRHGGMNYLAAERSVSARADPARLLPAARTILALAAPYPPPPIASHSPLEGTVAAYALGDDYHEVLRDRLELLCEFLDRLAGRRLENRICVDTGPVLERELASRAGLGWIGRNSMLIHPELGSYFFLAVILSELDLPPDPPFSADRCGTCDRCVKACPGGCILPDRTIDSRRCVSYLTIEHRGPIPRPLRELTGRSVFGCDICQAVCPWNRKPAAQVEACFLPRPHFPIRDLAGEYKLSEEEWRERFRRSAIRRTGRKGYRRNLLIALGNSRRKEGIPVLLEARNDPDPVLSECAEWALGRIDR